MRRGERRDLQFSVERHLHRTVGFMVLEGIARGSRSPLLFIRSNMTIHEVLEAHVLPYLRTLLNPLFQQDNARPHVTRATLEFFQQNRVNFLASPPRSPDFPPIEQVWDIMGRRLLHLPNPPQTLTDFRQVPWDAIPQEEIDHLIRSMPRRVAECVKHRGGPTHYCGFLA